MFHVYIIYNIISYKGNQSSLNLELINFNHHEGA